MRMQWRKNRLVPVEADGDAGLVRAISATKRTGNVPHYFGHLHRHTPIVDFNWCFQCRVRNIMEFIEEIGQGFW